MREVPHGQRECENCTFYHPERKEEPCSALGKLWNREHDCSLYIDNRREEEQKTVEAECAQGEAKSEPEAPVTQQHTIMPAEEHAPFRKLTNYDIYGLGNWDRRVTIDCPRSSLAELGKYVQAKLYADIEAGMKRSPRNLHAILDAWMAIMTAAQTEEQPKAE